MLQGFAVLVIGIDIGSQGEESSLGMYHNEIQKERNMIVYEKWSLYYVDKAYLVKAVWLGRVRQAKKQYLLAKHICCTTRLQTSSANLVTI